MFNITIFAMLSGVKSRPGLDGATGNDSLTLSIKQAASELMNEDEMAAILRHIDSVSKKYIYCPF